MIKDFILSVCVVNDFKAVVQSSGPAIKYYPEKQESSRHSSANISTLVTNHRAYKTQHPHHNGNVKVLDLVNAIGYMLV